jgi:hypothetical protein
MTCGKFEQEWYDKHVPNGKTVMYYPSEMSDSIFLCSENDCVFFFDTKDFQKVVREIEMKVV